MLRSAAPLPARADSFLAPTRRLTVRARARASAPLPEEQEPQADADTAAADDDFDFERAYQARLAAEGGRAGRLKRAPEERF